MAYLISLDKWCEDTGYPRTRFRSWKPKLQRGLHYFVYGKTTSVDPEEMDEWLRESGGVVAAGHYQQCSTDKDTTKRSNLHILKLD